MVRLLVFSDLHLDTPFRWAGRDLARARRRALRATLTRICDLAESEDVDAVLCGGDLYEHDRFTPDTRVFLRALLRAYTHAPSSSHPATTTGTATRASTAKVIGHPTSTSSPRRG